MRRLMIVITMGLAILTGCLPSIQSVAPANQTPVAYIDSVSSSQIAPGDEITFTGHGFDHDGSIVAYSWRSSIDGELSTSASFSTTSLSQGTHSIWFKVQDDKGMWSNEVAYNVNVLPSWATPPTIDLFEASPSELSVGQSSTLSWKVSNASTVTINPDVGSVALTGNRVVSPSKDTIYKLTANNKADTVTATTKVAIITVPVHTVELYSIAAEDGHVVRDGSIGPEPNVGDTVNGMAVQAFLSFDISMIPKDSKVINASLDLTAADVYGTPFALLGQLYVYSCQYVKLGSKNFIAGIPPGAIYSTPFMFSQPFTTRLLIEQVQEQVNAGNSRYQVRLQFAKYAYNNHHADYLGFGEALPRLIVTYED